MIFERFVRQVAESPYLDWKETIYAHRNVAQFLKVPGAMFRYTGTDQVPFDVFSRFENALDIIQTALSDPPSPDFDDTHPVDEKSAYHANADYLFLSACLFIDQVFNPYAELTLKPFTQKQCNRMADFIVALNTYEHANYPPDRIQKNWQDLWSDTGLPKEPRFEGRPSPSKRSYIRWKAIPSWIKVDLTARPA